MTTNTLGKETAIYDWHWEFDNITITADYTSLSSPEKFHQKDQQNTLLHPHPNLKSLDHSAH